MPSMPLVGEEYQALAVPLKKCVASFDVICFVEHFEDGCVVFNRFFEKF